MADSNITKRALATALKELMEEMPFSKISVTDICQKCEMNRKSFYYHFRDKYDLVNWIYDMEFIAVINKKEYKSSQEFLTDLCDYFYVNRTFYRKAFGMEGQNSFCDHFKEMMSPLIAERLEMKEPSLDEEEMEFRTDFFTEAVVGAIQRWIMDRNCVTSEKFIRLLEVCGRGFLIGDF